MVAQLWKSQFNCVNNVLINSPDKAGHPRSHSLWDIGKLEIRVLGTWDLGSGTVTWNLEHRFPLVTIYDTVKVLPAEF
jgi:hypothetical protein